MFNSTDVFAGLESAFNDGKAEGKKEMEAALRLACERIADSDQTYEEAKTADDWMQHFLEAAKGE